MFATPLPEGAGGLGQAGPWDGCKTASHCPPSPAIIGSRVPQLRGPGRVGHSWGGAGHSRGRNFPTESVAEAQLSGGGRGGRVAYGPPVPPSPSPHIPGLGLPCPTCRRPPLNLSP